MLLLVDMPTLVALTLGRTDTRTAPVITLQWQDNVCLSAAASMRCGGENTIV